MDKRGELIGPKSITTPQCFIHVSKMGVEEWSQGQLVVIDPPKYAKMLFKRMEYFGAFTVLHALIEFWMQNLYELNTFKKIGPLKAYEEHIAKARYRYRTLIRDLLRSKLISEGEAKRIEDFGLLRDRIVHRLVKYSYQTYPWHFIGKEEVVQGFERGLTLVDLLSARCNNRTSMTFVLRPSRKNLK